MFICLSVRAVPRNFFQSLLVPCCVLCRRGGGSGKLRNFLIWECRSLWQLLPNWQLMDRCRCLLLIFFSLTSFRFHYLSGVIPLTPVPCGVFWGVGEGKAWWSTGQGGASTGGGGGHGRGRTRRGGGHERGEARRVHYAPGSH
jgi:hypothetical protein